MRNIFHTILLYLSFAFVISFINSCAAPQSRSASSSNTTHIFKTEQNILHPKFAVFHRTNTTSELHFKVNSKDLLYSKQTGNENFTAHISIQYKLISSYETKDIIDSATIELSDPYSKNPKDLIGKMDFNANFTNSYVLEVSFTDINRNVT